MAKLGPTGARGEAAETIEFQHTLTAHHASLPPVYSTPDMIRLMETAAFHALQPCCEREFAARMRKSGDSFGCDERR
jgi:predicted thioesterase